MSYLVWRQDDWGWNLVQRYNTMEVRCGSKSVNVRKHPIKHEKVGQSEKKYLLALGTEILTKMECDWQQQKQHASTTIAPKTTHWAQGGWVTTKLHGIARKQGDLFSLRWVRKFKLKRDVIDNNKNNMTQQQLRPKQHIGAKENGVTTELHGTARKRGDNNEDNARISE